MKILLKLTEILFNHIHDPETLEKALIKESAFKERGRMSFPECLIFGLTHFTTSLTYALSQFFILYLRSDETITESAYSHIRENFDASPYQDGFKLIRDEIDRHYRKTGRLRRFEGWQILAVDGSAVALPDKKALFKEFGGINDSPTARMTLIYDTLNEIIYEAALDPFSTGERAQAMNLIRNLSEYLDLSRSVLIFDRGYISKGFIQELEDLGAEYLIRVRKKFNRQIDEAPMGDSILTINEKEVRILKIRLKSGVTETLITSLTEIPAERFEELYFLRWPIETAYDMIKNKIEMPNFDALLTNGIYHEFWISMLLANFIGPVARVTDEKIRERNSRHSNLKHEYQSSVSEIVNILRIELPFCLLTDSEEKRKKRLNQLTDILSHVEEPIRLNRCFPREIVRKVRYHYQRKHH